jgi:hypothetical protein
MALTPFDTSRTASRVQALCGLSPKALAALLECTIPALAEARLKRKETRRRKRAMGAGRKRLMSPEQEVLLTLIYLRHNVAHEVVGALFGVSADTSENTFHEVIAILQQVCPQHRWDAERKWKKSDPSWTPGELDRVLIDSFETPVPRPSTEEAQRRVYSGKKKTHTLKTQVATDGAGEILEIDAGHPGPTADKTLYEGSGVRDRYPKAEKWGDKAYQGTEGMRVPIKKPRGGELTDEQKAQNRAHAEVRVYVEHGNRRIKAFGIMRGKYRLAFGHFPRIAGVVVGLVHLIRLVS